MAAAFPGFPSPFKTIGHALDVLYVIFMNYVRGAFFALTLLFGFTTSLVYGADSFPAGSVHQVPKVGDTEDSVLSRFGPVKGRLSLPGGKLLLSFAVGDVIVQSGRVIDVPYLDTSVGLSNQDKKGSDLRALEAEINRRLIEYQSFRTAEDGQVRYVRKSFDLEAKGYDPTTGTILFAGRTYPLNSTSLHQMIFSVDSRGFGYFGFFRNGIRALEPGAGSYVPFEFTKCNFRAGNDSYVVKAHGYSQRSVTVGPGYEFAFFGDQQVLDKLAKYGAGIDFHVSGRMGSLSDSLTGLERAAFRDGMSLLELIRRKNRILYGSDLAPETSDPAPIARQPSDSEKKDKGASFGSGMVFSRAGHIFTNHHVIQGGRRHFVVRIVDGKVTERFEAQLVLVDPKNDLAILRAKDWSPTAFAEAGPPVVAATDDCKLGSQVFVLGYPFPGLVSSNVKYTKGDVSDLSGLDDDKTMIQHTAQIQPGNSGGPMCLMDGRVVGVVVSSLNSVQVLKETGALPQGINFAIKSDVLLEMSKRANVVLPTSRIQANPVEHVRAYTVQIISEP
jgi:S1-C subfamily serine protease